MVIQLNKKVGKLMEYASMIEKLKKVGIKFTDGLSDKEIEKIENTFGFKFPKEIASFLSYAYPPRYRRCRREFPQWLYR